MLKPLLVVIVSTSMLMGMFVGRVIEPPVPSPSATVEPTQTPEASPIQSDAPEIITGTASWFDAERGSQTSWYTRKGIQWYAAAGPALRELIGDSNPYLEDYLVLITNTKTGRSAVAHVVDWCSCSKGNAREKIVDLSPSLWVALSGQPLSVGIQTVTIQLLP